MPKKGTKLAKWIFYTFLAGLIPYIARIIVFYANKAQASLKAEYLLNSGDCAALGVVLSITIINEFGGLSIGEKAIKTVFTGASALSLIVYGMLIFCALQQTLKADTHSFNSEIFLISLGFCIISIIMGFVSNFIIVSIEKNSLDLKYDQ